MSSTVTTTIGTTPMRPSIPPPRPWRTASRAWRRFTATGRHTASGQRFNQEAFTAAHRSLPFGTRLRVTHAGRSVVVTVNDRGPFVHGRVLDLSTAAARAVGLTSRGVGLVVAEVL